MQGVAEQESTRKRSEGEASAKVEMARAEKISLDTIAEAIEADGCSQTEFMISKRYGAYSPCTRVRLCVSLCVAVPWYALMCVRVCVYVCAAVQVQ